MKFTAFTLAALLLVLAGQGSYADDVLSDEVIHDCNADLVYPKQYEECDYTQKDHRSPAYATCSLTYFLVETHERITATGNGKTMTIRYAVRKRKSYSTNGSDKDNSFTARSVAYDQLRPTIERVRRNVCK